MTSWSSRMKVTWKQDHDEKGTFDKDDNERHDTNPQYPRLPNNRFQGTQYISHNDAKLSFSRMAGRQACQIISSCPSPPGPSRWAQQVLFSLKAVRFKFAEPSVSLRNSSLHVAITSSLLAWNGCFKLAELSDPMTHVANHKQSLLAWKRSVSECLPTACSLWWDPILAPRHVRPRAG